MYPRIFESQVTNSHILQERSVLMAREHGKLWRLTLIERRSLSITIKLARGTPASINGLGGEILLLFVCCGYSLSMRVEVEEKDFLCTTELRKRMDPRLQELAPQAEVARRRDHAT